MSNSMENVDIIRMRYFKKRSWNACVITFPVLKMENTELLGRFLRENVAETVDIASVGTDYGIPSHFRFSNYSSPSTIFVFCGAYHIIFSGSIVSNYI